MTRKELKKIARRWIVDIWQTRHVDAVEQLHAPDFIDRSPAADDPSRGGYRAALVELFEVFPDFYTDIEYLVVDEESQKVAIRWTATGTHSAEYLGFPATFKEVYMEGIEILGIRDGLISERWGEWDLASLLAQLGDES